MTTDIRNNPVMDLTTAVDLYSKFVNNSWNYVIKFLVTEGNEFSIHDWLQANWEILVERNILDDGHYLEVYGEGADIYGGSSRIIDISAKADYRILVNKKPESTLVDLLDDQYTDSLDLHFDKLVNFKNGYYEMEPPLDYVLAFDSLNGIERIFHIDSVQLSLGKIKY